MSKETYRTVHLQVNTVMKNMSTKLSDDDVIDILHDHLNRSFGLYVDREQISIVKEGDNE